MQRLSSIAVICLGLVLGSSAVFNRVTLENNAYKGLLVAVNPDVPEDPDIIEAIKVRVCVLFSKY